jgi:aminoglycoside phosphotransferase (APT) family kinase protein
MTSAGINGLLKIAEGREAEIFAWEAGAVLKLYRGAGWARSRDIERVSMDAVKEAGGPAPTALGFTEIDGRPGLLMERIEGIDMLTQLGAKPWTVLSAGGRLGRAHAALHEVVAPPALLPLKERHTVALRSSDRVPAPVAGRAVAALASLPDGDRICHGDFHPGNVILTRRGPVVIDWPNSVRGDPSADVARTLLLIRLGELPPGASALLRALDSIGRKIIVRGYLSAYRKARQLDVALLDRWLLPVAAHRLAEGIPEERAKLLALLGEA